MSAVAQASSGTRSGTGTAGSAAAQQSPAPGGRRQPRGDLPLAIWGVLVLLFLFLPVLVMVCYAFNTGRSMLVWEGFGFTSFRSALENSTITRAIQVSLLAALGTAVVSALLGSCAGLALGRHAGRWSPAFQLLLGLVMVTPEIVDAVSMLPWFVSLGGEHHVTVLNFGLVRLVVAHSLFATAVVTFIVSARMQGLDSSLEEAAADLYAPPWHRFTQVTFPLMRPAVIAGGLLAFTLSLDNTVLSAFVSVAGSTPWPVYVFSAVRSTLRPEIAAVSALMLVLTLVVLGLVGYVLKRSGDSSAQIARTLTGG